MGKLLEPSRKSRLVPELRDGDRMHTQEFLRRYEAAPEGVRAELVNGVVHVNRWKETDFHGQGRLMPPISGGHSEPQCDLTGWLAVYRANTVGVMASSPTTLILSDSDSTPEPDALLRILPEYGGTCSLDDNGYYNGPPELIVEVAKTTASRDLGSKLEMYQRNSVQEYLVWRVESRAIDWFTLHRREYRPLVADATGIIKSRVFPGLWLDPAALLTSDMATVLTVLQTGIASPEHAKFVEKLRKKKAKKK